MTEPNNDIYKEEEDSQKGRFLTFTLDDNVYGVAIRFVTEIIGVQTITNVPETPDYIKGIINLRGKIIPLIEVRLKFGKTEIPYTERTCIIVVNIAEMVVGLIVDKVDDVLTIPDEMIAEPPDGRLGFEDRYIEGIGKVEDEVLLLLNLDQLLKPDETVAVSAVMSEVSEE